MCSVCQGKSKVKYFRKLQKGIWFAKLYFYTKNEFDQGLKAFLVDLKRLTVVQH